MLSNFLQKFSHALNKTSGFFKENFNKLLSNFTTVDKNLIGSIEQTLIESDAGVTLAREITEDLGRLNREKKIKTAQDAINYIQKKFTDLLSKLNYELQTSSSSPTIYMFVGVNGTGKTTSIGKLAYLLKNQNKKVILAACDTFRAAAIEQLEIWSKRADVEIVKQLRGADPAATCYDALEKA
ncbi:MAG: signal recognition particle receptor subunit alpha, partial [Planctomycetes bacterium]|nr:signal recognition particle receptor subunit alpha [Planctomycetota bacterium]